MRLKPIGRDESRPYNKMRLGRIMANTPEAIAFIGGLHALKRIATPEESAKSALYLTSDASSFTTSTAMLVDGGVSINKT